MRQHRIIGLIGGMSWESTALYYRLINEEMQVRLGGHHNARSALYTVDFSDLLELASAGRWEAVADLLTEAAHALQRAGADFFLLTANTAHAVADMVAAEVGIPMLHIADVTAAEITSRGLNRVGLMGTKHTLEGDFYRGRLHDRHGLSVDLPDPEEGEFLQRTIMDELALGTINDVSKAGCLRIVDRLAASGSQGVIVGCTELPLLFGQADTPIPLFETTRLHARAAVDVALTAAGNAIEAFSSSRMKT